jgi:hypothetical protein
VDLPYPFLAVVSLNCCVIWTSRKPQSILIRFPSRLALSLAFEEKLRAKNKREVKNMVNSCAGGEQRLVLTQTVFMKKGYCRKGMVFLVDLCWELY